MGRRWRPRPGAASVSDALQGESLRRRVEEEHEAGGRPRSVGGDEHGFSTSVNGCSCHVLTPFADTVSDVPPDVFTSTLAVPRTSTRTPPCSVTAEARDGTLRSPVSVIALTRSRNGSFECTIWRTRSRNAPSSPGPATRATRDPTSEIAWSSPSAIYVAPIAAEARGGGGEPPDRQPENAANWIVPMPGYL